MLGTLSTAMMTAARTDSLRPDARRPAPREPQARIAPPRKRMFSRLRAMIAAPRTP